MVLNFLSLPLMRVSQFYESFEICGVIHLN